jgi:hypothetical protein
VFVCITQHENADRARAERIFKARERREAGAPKATADYYAAGGTELTAPRSRPFAQAAGGARLKLFAPFRDCQRRAEDIPGFFFKANSRE